MQKKEFDSPFFLDSLPPIRVGLLGMGTVGGGTFRLLNRNQNEISRRLGRSIQIVRVADLDVERARRIVGPGIDVVQDPFQLVRDPSLDIIVELIGGCTIAKELILAAISNGKHVVTANKALLASYGEHIFEQASQKQVMVAFEASVAGGIPIIKMVREGLTANQIEWIAGIVNGTTNFILSQMRYENRTFHEALKSSQELGYAESDPTLDIEGIDAAHKAAILASIAFGIQVPFEKVYVEGISTISELDVKYAQAFGYCIKLLAIVRRQVAEGKYTGVEVRVHPTLVPEKSLIGNVNGVMNAVWVRADAVGDLMFYGAGAGADATASAVVADLVDTARMVSVAPTHRVPYRAFQNIIDVPILPIQDIRTAFYLRFCVRDVPGVLSEIVHCLDKSGISIRALAQHASVFVTSLGESTVQSTDLVLLIHPIMESFLNEAMSYIEKLPSVLSKPVRIRVENFES